MLGVVIVSGISWVCLSRLNYVYFLLVKQMYGYEIIDFSYMCDVDWSWINVNRREYPSRHLSTPFFTFLSQSSSLHLSILIMFQYF